MIRHFRLLTFVIAILTISVWVSAAAQAQSKGSIEQTFQKARKDYLQKDMKAAADEVRKGAAYLKSEAAAAKGKGKEALTASYQELEKLAGEMEKGTVKTVKELEMAFARAYNALATNSHVKSAESWAKKEYKKAGNELEAAAGELEKGYIWAEQKAEAEARKQAALEAALVKKAEAEAKKIAAQEAAAARKLAAEQAKLAAQELAAAKKAEAEARKAAAAQAKQIAQQEAAERKAAAALKKAEAAARKAALAPPEPVWPFPEEETKEASSV